MERYKTKNGFTLIEILVSGTILVIAMALIAVFFVKAQKIRVAVMKENNIQVIANNQMMNGALYGVSQTSDGLMYATRIEAIDLPTPPTPSRWVEFAGSTNYVRLEIGIDDDGTTYTLYQQTAPISGGWPPATWTPIPPKNLDPNNKINLTTDSHFAFYDNTGTNTTASAAISQVEIYLSVIDKNLPGAQPVILRNTVTLKNIPQID